MTEPTERTLVLIKPDGVKRHLIGEILDYPAQMRRMYHSLVARVASGELHQPAALNAARRAFAEVFDAHRDVLARYSELAAEFESETEASPKTDRSKSRPKRTAGKSA